jgi:sugar phosphate permease
MKTGIAILTFAYVLSQFFRAFLAVMAQDLSADIGATAADLSRASGYWFLAFAAAQIPVGEALDRVGPRLTAGVVLAVAALGAWWFARADSVRDIEIAMALIGVGCSAVLMAVYYIIARTYRPAVFATFAGIVIGIGSLGNLASALPMILAIEAMGWRTTMLVLAAITGATAIAIVLLVGDPEKLGGNQKGSVFSILRIPAMWLILPMMFVNYAPSAGLRGLWAGPYATDVFDASSATVGTVTFLVALAMIAGSLSYGPMDRIFGTRKRVVQCGTTMGALACLTLWAFPAYSLVLSTALIAAIGLLGAGMPMLMAHGRSFLPQHLVGRGVSLMNLFGMGGVGVMQMVTGPIHSSVLEAGGTPVEAYQALFLLFGLMILAGVAIYSFSEDRIS